MAQNTQAPRVSWWSRLDGGLRQLASGGRPKFCLEGNQPTDRGWAAKAAVVLLIFL